MAFIFTSESVTEGHPDKVADAISDAVLDAMLTFDRESRVAVETFVANGVVVIAGEATTRSYVDIQALVRQRLVEIGYDHADKGIDGHSCGVMVALNSQSADIAQGVSGSWESTHDEAKEDFDAQGAGDQGLMFGYACDETDEFMPLPITMAHAMSARLAEVRHEGICPFLRPDGKTQVSVIYDENHRPVGIDTVVLSAQHDPDVDVESQLRPQMIEQVISVILERYGWADQDPRILINPTGRFVVGGPAGDAGLTGRKIIVDTYGGMARHGGGAFSGKDPSKVDRSASYAMRWVAKNIVAAGLAKRCEAQVSYAIGSAHPTSFLIDTFGTGIVSDERLCQAAKKVFDLRPAAIIEALDLKRPIYSATTNYGHFGRLFPQATWECTDRIEDLKVALS